MLAVVSVLCVRGCGGYCQCDRRWCVVAERTLPHSIEAEKSVLGAILVNNLAFLPAAERLFPDDFFRDAHRRIFEAMLRLTDRNVPVDFVTLTEQLRKSGELDEVGGAAYVSGLTEGVPRSANVQYYAGIVKEKSRLRGIIRAANEMLVSAYDAGDEAADVIDAVERSVFALSQERQTSRLRPIGDLIAPTIANVEEHQNAGRNVLGLSSGFSQLDGLTSGFRPGQLIVLAARPGMGKSAMILNIADHVARKESKTVALFSLEMSGEELCVRLLTSHAQVSSRRFQRAQLTESEYFRLGSSVNELSDVSILVDDTAMLGLWELRAKCRSAAIGAAGTAAPLGLVIIDYLQLMVGDAKAENRNLQISQITRGLKGMAKELGLPVIILSQLSRANEARQNKKPMLSDLRDSGAIEQDADVVLFIHREEVYKATEANRGRADLIIAKQRSGPIGEIELLWDGASTRFSDAAPASLHD